jgi:hypothetical protein
MSSSNRLITVGEIARRTDSSLHQVEYLIRSRGITSQGQAGTARVFTEEDVTRIANELAQIGARRSNGGAL